MDSAKTRTTALQSLLSALKDSSSSADHDGLSPVPWALVKACGSNIPAFVDELSDGEAEMSESVTVSANLNSSFKDLTTFLEPKLKAEFDGVLSWIGGLWTNPEAEAAAQVDLCPPKGHIPEATGWEERVQMLRSSAF